MDNENPTAGDSGASIEDRLVNLWTAEETPEQPKDQAQQTPNPDSADDPEVPENGAPEDDKQPQLTTAELAKVLGVDESTLDVDDDGNISVKTKIDGKDGAAKFADLLKTYQLQGHAENRARAVAEQEKALQARAQEVEQQFQQRLQHAEHLAQLAQQELLNEFQSIDWKSLDQHPDQGAVAALKLKFQERNWKIQNALQGVNAQRGQLNEQAKAQNAERLRGEAAKLATLIPEWKDAAVAKKEQQEILDWGLKAGYTPEVMESLNNSSALAVWTFRNAMLHDTQKASKAIVEARVRTAPKLVKSGSAAVETAETKARSLKQSVSKTGGKNGTLEAWLIATGKV